MAGGCLLTLVVEETLRCVGVGLRISRDSADRLGASERSFEGITGVGLP